jgi:hypothetical protein
MSHHLDTPLAASTGQLYLEDSATGELVLQGRRTVARRLLPDVLPYAAGTPATCGFAAFNGRRGWGGHWPAAYDGLPGVWAVRSALRMRANWPGETMAMCPLASRRTM